MLAKILLIFSLLVSLSLTVVAQTATRDIVKEQAIWEELRKIAPDAVEDFKAGTIAMDSGDNDEAIRRYEVVRMQAPEFDQVLRRLGYALAARGEVDKGLVLLETALKRNRSPENLLGLARTLAYPSEKAEGSPQQKLRALALAKEANAMTKTGDDADYIITVGELALQLEKADDFRNATEHLVAHHPELMITHYFSAILAASDEKWITAENEIKKAEAMGLPHEVVQQFLDSGVHTRATIWHYLIYALCLVALWIVGLALLFLVGKLMSRKTLRSIESGDPNTSATSSDISLRKWYRILINLAGFYYYMSLPVIIFLVIFVASAITYGFFMADRIPIKLVAILCVGALVTVYKMIRSLFLKIESDDPGRSLSYEEAPGLWDLARAVAAAVGTRAVDEIRITPGTDLAVYEKGSFRERSNDKAKRILIVGGGVLNDFEQTGFRAVLAHEYGHFSHRDTAGGDIAIRVNADMMKFAHAMVLSGQNVWWNIAFHFLRIYHFIFRRISHGATRLQEVLADRVAASMYGPKAFEQGLTHVVRKAVEFRYLATKEINESANARRALQNLYDLQPSDNPDLEAEIKKSLERKTSEDDTHPSPTDRFRFTSRITNVGEQLVSGKVWDLFKDKEALTSEMTKMIQYKL
ncbi:MAG TPA: M48 family metalloprotease [Pyrinomonadaceae bacterium]|jgi:Zn-dependent protease with chaperone function|nr:M48 family metalloprotease [Pyrinomonadaceae bacterium]